MGLEHQGLENGSFKKVRFERKAIEKDNITNKIDILTDVPPETRDETVRKREGVKRPKSPSPHSRQQRGSHSHRSRFENDSKEMCDAELDATELPRGSYKALNHSPLQRTATVPSRMRTRVYRMSSSPALLLSDTSGNAGHINSRYDTNGNALPDMRTEGVRSYDVNTGQHPGHEVQTT